jgi:hypothetical protein
VAVVLRTDFPIAPGTATPTSKSLNVPSEAVSYVYTLYYWNIYVDLEGYETVLLSLSVTLSKRSMVVAVFSVFAKGDANGVLRLYVGGQKVAESTLDDSTKLRVLHGYAVLAPGTYEVKATHYTATSPAQLEWYSYSYGNPAGMLVVYVVPLE